MHLEGMAPHSSPPACMHAEAHVPHRVHGGGHEHRQRPRALLPPACDIHGDAAGLVGAGVGGGVEGTLGFGV